MNHSRRTLLIMATTMAALFCGNSRADDYRVRPIRLIIPFSAGGATDVMGRLVSAEMARHLGQAVIVENKAGAAGAIGTDAVAKSASAYTFVGLNVPAGGTPDAYVEFLRKENEKWISVIQRAGVTSNE
jgi:tripartite-type tricarboxylate transporter receptor subunit TctC